MEHKATSSSSIGAASKTGFHVGVFPFPFSSHPAAIIGVIKHIASLAPDVHFTFFGTEGSTASLFSANKKEEVPPNIKPFYVWDGVPKGWQDNHHPREGMAGYLDKVDFFMKEGHDTLEKAVVEAEAETGKKLTSMIVEPFLYFMADLAEKMSVPWVACLTSGAHHLTARLHGDLIRQKLETYLPGADINEERILDENLNSFINIPGLSEFRIRDLPYDLIRDLPDDSMAKLLRRMECIFPTAAAVVINSVEELHPELTSDLKSKFNRFFCIGPLYLTLPPLSSEHLLQLQEDPHHCLQWLDQQPAQSVVYISFGTVVRLAPEEIVAIATAIQDVASSFIWSVKPQQMSQLPTSFVDWAKELGKGLLVPWAPQIKVLEHPSVGAFLTHYGWKSVTESVGSGVPMIGRPFFGDQHVNARLVEMKWGVGVVVVGDDDDKSTVEVMTRKGVVKALERVMIDGEERKRMMENAGRLKEVIRLGLGPQGSSSHNFNALVKMVMT